MTQDQSSSHIVPCNSEQIYKISTFANEAYTLTNATTVKTFL